MQPADPSVGQVPAEHLARNQSTSIAGPGGRPGRRAGSRQTRRMAAGVGLVVAFAAVGAGAYAAGASGKSGLEQSLTQTSARLSATQTQLSTARASLISEQDQVAQEQTIAQQATQTAQAKAKAQYAAEMATLKQEQQNLTSEEKTVKTEAGQLQASSISSSGVYVVGADIRSGIWHTDGDGGMTGNNCYFATLNSTNTTDISNNNNFDGAETVNLSGVYAFEISGPCSWYRVG